MKYILWIFLYCLSSTFLNAQMVLYAEDFNGGLPEDWSAIEIQGNGTASANWTWTNFGPQGDFAVPPLQSSTAGNGWMIFDSDLNCRFDNQEAWLVSPQLSADGEPNIFLSFQTYYRSFNDRPTLEVSTDSMNWTSIELFPQIEANEYGAGSADDNPQLINLELSDLVGGEATYWIAFRFLSDETTGNGGDGTGCAYSWQIDDVQILNQDSRATDDLSISPSFFAIAPNAFTPASQVEAFGFLADVNNDGSQEQMEATLSVQIEEVGGEVVFDAQTTIPSVGVDSVVENITIEETFTPEAEVAFYEGVYTLSIDNQDATPANNRRDFLFGVSDTIYSKWLENINLAIRPAADNSYAYGNCYYVPNGDGFFARYVTFAVDNADELIGEDANILTYKWEGDLNEDGFATPDEYGNAPLVFNTYTFDGTEDGFITIPLSIDEIGVPLEDDSYYFTVIQYDSDDELSIDLLGTTEFDYQAMYIRSLIEGSPRYASMLDVGNTGDFSVVGFGFDVVPVVDISIGESGDLISNTRPRLSTENVIELYPTPTNDWLRVHLDLVEMQSVELRLFDATGRLLNVRNFQQLQEQTFQYDVNNFAAGIYFLQVRAEKGIRTLKFIVDK